MEMNFTGRVVVVTEALAKALGLTPTEYPPGPSTPCPGCGTTKEPSVGYTAPATFMCACGAQWSEPGTGIKILTAEESRAKRPEWYPPEGS